MGRFSSRVVFVLVFVAINSVAPALATNHVVGYDDGWTYNFNYTSWVHVKTFYIGDNLIFKYEKEFHNVFIVNGTEFEQCQVLGNQTPMDSGYDVIPFNTPGNAWFICEVEEHCLTGQKLAITVMDQTAPQQSPLPDPTTSFPPPPPPPSRATIAAASGSFGFMVMAFYILGMIMA